MVRPHVIQVAGEFILESIGCGGVEVNRQPQKAISFSKEAELLASSFDPRPCDEKPQGN
jgi:hypothetical protein